MRIRDLHLQGFRNLHQLRWQPGPGFNLISGANGAGKTSLLEAVHLLSHGRSFRTGQTDAMIQRGEAGFSLFAGCVDGEGSSFELGMARCSTGWTLRRNGGVIESLVEFVGHAAVVTIEPESHLLVSGPAEYRRRFLDWLLFHVEPDFLPVWRRYMRCLRQRNAVLRDLPRAGVESVLAWEPSLADSGVAIDGKRRELVDSLQSRLTEVAVMLAPTLGCHGLAYRSGWAQGIGLLQALQEGRAGDIERGFTQRGPHRADWRLALGEGLNQGALSRGQNKLLALACLLAQASLHQFRTGAWPTLVFDDLGAELDRAHLGRVLQWLASSGAQVFITGTEFGPEWRQQVPEGSCWFHVEQGRLEPLLY